jgi:hypothetical protein
MITFYKTVSKNDDLSCGNFELLSGSHYASVGDSDY